MAINPNIALQVRPPEIESPLNALAKASQVKNAMNQNRLFDMKVAESERQQQRQNALIQATRNALDPSTGRLDADKYRRSLGELGDYEGLQSFEKTHAEQRKADIEAKKSELALALDKQKTVAQYAGAAKDQASWSQGLEELKAMGIDVSQVPQQFSPQTAELFRGRALTGAQQLEQMWKKLDYDLNVDKFDETKRSNQVSEGISRGNLGVAQVGLTLRKEANDIARANSTAGKAPSGYRFKQDGSLEAIPGGPADSKSGDVKLTEDQGKATGWLVQAENAFDNMQKATSGEIDPKTRKPIGTPSAARPGFPDVVAAIPSMGIGGAIANTMRSADRQKFMQGASSLSESLLRAATGAGVNKDEAAQKIRELTPVFGDDDATIKQKMEAIPLYIDSLKVRAGPGARKAQGIAEAKKAPNIDDLLKKYGD